MLESQERILLAEAFAEYHRALIAALPREEDLREIEISERLEKRMSRLIERQKHFYYSWVNTAAKRVACILAAVLLATATVTASVQSLRESVTYFLVEIFEEGSLYRFFNFRQDPSIKDQPIDVHLPGYIPNGYRLTEEQEEGFFYEGEGAKCFYFAQYPNGTEVYAPDVETKNISVAGEYEGVLLCKGEIRKLFFNDGKYLYVINGTLSEEEILKIAESIPLE